MNEMYLDSRQGKRNSDAPQTDTGVSVAFAVPHTAKRADFFISCHQRTSVLSVGCGVHIGKVTSGIREDRRLYLAGERHLAFFVPKSQTDTRCPMFSNSSPIPQQRVLLQQMEALTSGFAELLEWNAARTDATCEDVNRARCYLSLVNEVRRLLFELCPAEVMYAMNEEADHD